MGDLIHLGRASLTVDLAPGPLEEIRCIGSFSIVRLIIARQPEAYPGQLLVVLDGRPEVGAEAVTNAPDTPEGRRLADYAAHAVLRALMFFVNDGQRPINPVAPPENQP